MLHLRLAIFLRKSGTKRACGWFCQHRFSKQFTWRKTGIQKLCFNRKHFLHIACLSELTEPPWLHPFPELPLKPWFTNKTFIWCHALQMSLDLTLRNMSDKLSPLESISFINLSVTGTSKVHVLRCLHNASQGLFLVINTSVFMLWNECTHPEVCIATAHSVRIQGGSLYLQNKFKSAGTVSSCPFVLFILSKMMDACM